MFFTYSVRQNVTAWQNGVGLDLFDGNHFTTARKLDLEAGWLLPVFDSDRCVGSFHGWLLFASLDSDCCVGSFHDRHYRRSEIRNLSL
jgi:hypothetical protein